MPYLTRNPIESYWLTPVYYTTIRKTTMLRDYRIKIIILLVNQEEEHLIESCSRITAMQLKTPPAFTARCVLLY